MSRWTAYYVDTDTWYAISAILGTLWLTMLVKVYKDTSYFYVACIAWLLLIYSIGAFFGIYATYWINRNFYVSTSLCLKWSLARSVFIFMRDFGTCVAHWVFGFKYFKIGSVYKYFAA